MTGRVLTLEGDPPSFAVVDRPTPVPAEGEALLLLLAAEVKPLEVQIASGTHRFSPPTPLGTSAVAEVVDGPHPLGTRVAVIGGNAGMGLTRPGCYADEFLAPSNILVPLPGGMDPLRAAASLSTVLTSYRTLTDHSEFSRGDTVLVLGSTGGVGDAAVQLFARAGARVLAASRSPMRAHAEVVEPILLDRFETEVAATTDNQGVDIIIDTLGGEYTGRAIAAGARGCRHVVVGYSAGPTTSLAPGALIAREHRLIGFNLYSGEPEVATAAAAEALKLVADGEVEVNVKSAHDLEDATGAFASVGGWQRVLLTGRAAAGKDRASPHAD